MRHTILVAALSSVAASVVTTAVISGSLFGVGTASSANTPVEAEGAVSPGGVTSILQGDINCDGVVDAKDALGDLRYVGGLNVQQTEPCPDIGTLAAIPGPAGPQGEQGPAGPQGEPGISNITTEFEIGPHNSLGNKLLDIDCPDGMMALGGGGTAWGNTNEVALITSVPKVTGLGGAAIGWYVGAEEIDGTGEDWSLTVWVICAKVAE